MPQDILSLDIHTCGHKANSNLLAKNHWSIISKISRLCSLTLCYLSVKSYSKHKIELNLSLWINITLKDSVNLIEFNITPTNHSYSSDFLAQKSASYGILEHTFVFVHDQGLHRQSIFDQKPSHSL